MGDAPIHLPAYFFTALQRNVGAEARQPVDEARMAEEKLMQAAKMVAGLTAHPGWQVMRDLIEQKIEDLHLSVLTVANPLPHEKLIQVLAQEAALREVLRAPEVVLGQAQRAAIQREQAAERAARSNP